MVKHERWRLKKRRTLMERVEDTLLHPVPRAGSLWTPGPTRVIPCAGCMQRSDEQPMSESPYTCTAQCTAISSTGIPCLRFSEQQCAAHLWMINSCWSCQDPVPPLDGLTGSTIRALRPWEWWWSGEPRMHCICMPAPCLSGDGSKNLTPIMQRWALPPTMSLPFYCRRWVMMDWWRSDAMRGSWSRLVRLRLDHGGLILLGVMEME